MGPHPMVYHRPYLLRMGIVCASDLRELPHGRKTSIAGCVIAWQRPGTAKGFVFLSLEDETGISNAIVTHAVYEQYAATRDLRQIPDCRGQTPESGERVAVKADIVRALEVSPLEVRSHDFY